MLPHRFALVIALVGYASLAAAETKNIDRTLPLSATGTVAVEAHNGWIQVRTWDRPQVEVHVRIDWPGLSASSYRFREVTVDIDGSVDRVSIRSHLPEQFGWTLWSLLEGSWSGPEVHYTITAPRTARLDIRNHNADTDIRDVNAAVRLATHNGVVRVANLVGPLDLNMHNGWARVEFASFTQDSRLTTHNAWVELTLPAASKFDLDSRGHHMLVQSDFQLATRAAYSRRPWENVSGSVNGGGPHLLVVSHNGSFRLRSK